MKAKMTLSYESQTDVNLSVESTNEGVIIYINKGCYLVGLTAEDANELALMLQKASQHTVKLNNGDLT